jgi:hypothetical protein
VRHLFNKYELWIVSTTSKAQLYLWNNWRVLFPLVDRLVGLSPAKAFIRSYQAYEQEHGWLGFGRMSWNRENNEKWAKKYRENEDNGSGVRFFDTQIWAPDWNHAAKTGIPPDLFIRLFSEPESQIAKEGLIVAIKKAIAEKNAAAIESVIADVSRRVPDSTVKRITRSWFAGAGFGNRIEDMNPQELEMIVKGNVTPSLVHRFQSILRSK